MTTQQDQSGTTYQSPDSKPASDGTKVVINTPNGPKSGVMVGGYVVPNK